MEKETAPEVETARMTTEADSHKLKRQLRDLLASATFQKVQQQYSNMGMPRIVYPYPAFRTTVLSTTESLGYSSLLFLISK